MRPNDRPAIVTVAVPITTAHAGQPPAIDNALREAEDVARAAGCHRTGRWTVLDTREADDLAAVVARKLDTDTSWLVLTAEVMG